MIFQEKSSDVSTKINFHQDMETVFQLPKTTFIGGKSETALPLKEIINRLENVYCRSIGAEYMHINNLDQINWIRQRLESPGAMELNNTEKRLLLARHVTLLAIELQCITFELIFAGSAAV